jgi:hypothetical protein
MSSPQQNSTEQRLCLRQKVDHDVLLSHHRGQPIRVVLTDMSLSGAFVRTPVQLLPLTPIRITWRRVGAPALRRSTLQAHVIRQSPDGLGIEWEEFAPRQVCARLNRQWMREVIEAMREAGAAGRSVE